MNLYEIKENYLDFLNKIESGEIETEYINDTLESILDDFNTKVDNISSFIKNLKSEAQAISDESKKLNERAKQKESKAESLLQYVEKMLKESGIKKVETARNAVQLKLSPPSLKVDDGFIEWAKENSTEFVRAKTTFDPDKNAIKEALKQGQEIPYCRLEQSEKINIK